MDAIETDNTIPPSSPTTLPPSSPVNDAIRSIEERYAINVKANNDYKLCNSSNTSMNSSLNKSMTNDLNSLKLGCAESTDVPMDESLISTTIATSGTVETEETDETDLSRYTENAQRRVTRHDCTVELPSSSILSGLSTNSDFTPISSASSDHLTPITIDYFTPIADYSQFAQKTKVMDFIPSQYRSSRTQVRDIEEGKRIRKIIDIIPRKLQQPKSITAQKIKNWSCPMVSSATSPSSQSIFKARPMPRFADIHNKMSALNEASKELTQNHQHQQNNRKSTQFVPTKTQSFKFESDIRIIKRREFDRLVALKMSQIEGQKTLDNLQKTADINKLIKELREKSIDEGGLNFRASPIQTRDMFPTCVVHTLPATRPRSPKFSTIIGGSNTKRGKSSTQNLQ